MLNKLFIDILKSKFELNNINKNFYTYFNISTQTNNNDTTKLITLILKYLNIFKKRMINNDSCK